MFTGLIEDVGDDRRFAAATEVGGADRQNQVAGSLDGTRRERRGQWRLLDRRQERAPSRLPWTSRQKLCSAPAWRTLTIGSLVNLERPMRLADRLGGHLVTGHVDGVGAVAAIEKQGEFTIVTFDVPAPLGALLVPKGSVAVDGISLTVNVCRKQRFSVAIIPFTLRHTNLRARRVGDKVNIETDLIGKYVQSFMRQRG